MPTPPLTYEEHGLPILEAAPGTRIMRELAAKVGLPPSTLENRIKSFGMKEEVRAAMRGEPGPAPGPAPGAERLRDVTTREGRELEALRVSTKELRKENKKLRAHLVDQETLVERIVAESTEPMPRPTFRVRASNRPDKPRRDVLLPIFDCQFGSAVRPRDTVNGVGSFDSKIFEQRLHLYVEKTAKTMRDYAAGHTLENMVFALGGDMVEGEEIYKGMEWHLELHPSEQIFGIRDHLAYAIDALMGVGAELGVRQASVLCVPGNHGKVGGKKAGDKPPEHSWDYIAFRMLKERLANHPIKTFAIEAAGAAFFDVKGNLFGMIHGDEIKGHMSIPFYGITRQDARMIRTANVIPDYVLVGHHHQPASIPVGYGEWLMSGNWVGGTSLSKIVGSNTPSQSIFFVSEEHGVCDRSLLYLDRRRKPQATVHETA